MGRMKINTIKLPFPMPRLRRIKARGKDKTRQNAVLARDNRSDKRSAFACSGVRIERTFATVKAPLLSVIEYDQQDRNHRKTDHPDDIGAG